MSDREVLAVVMSEREKLRDKILSERKNGNIVFHVLPGELMGAKLDDFVEQPADGMLYDLNRSEEISLTFLDDQKWVNDYAIALVIRKLVEQRDKARAELIAAVKALAAPQPPSEEGGKWKR